MAVEGTPDKSTAAASATGAVSTGQSGASAPVVSSGTASEAMIAAAMAASSADTTPAGTGAGDTTPQGAGGTGVAKPDATGQPAGTGSTGEPAGTGEAPVSRIEAAVRNAREETRREVEAQFAPFKGMKLEDVQTAMAVVQQLQSDPKAFFAELGERINGNTETQEEYPAADLVSKDGSLKTYSDVTFQKALDVHGKRVVSQVMKELAPFLNYTREEHGRRTNDAAEAARVQTVTSALVEARKMPHFTPENEPAILASISAIPEETRKAIGPVAVIHMAYNAFLRDKVFPGIDAEADKRVRAEFARKAASSGGAHPADSGGDPKPVTLRPGDVDGLARHMERLATAATA